MVKGPLLTFGFEHLSENAPLSKSTESQDALMTGSHVRREKAALFQWVQGPPGDSLQPEAAGAGMEVTKCLKPPDSGHDFGDRASVQAATRVNAEQASKRTMCRPTR